MPLNQESFITPDVPLGVQRLLSGYAEARSWPRYSQETDWVYKRGSSAWAHSVSRTTLSSVKKAAPAFMRAPFGRVGELNPSSPTLCYAYYTDMPTMRWAMDWSDNQALMKQCELQLQFATDTEGTASWQAKAGFQIARCPSLDDVTAVCNFFARPFAEAKSIYLGPARDLLSKDQLAFVEADITPDPLKFFTLWHEGITIRLTRMNERIKTIPYASGSFRTIRPRVEQGTAHMASLIREEQVLQSSLLNDRVIPAGRSVRRRPRAIERADQISEASKGQPVLSTYAETFGHETSADARMSSMPGTQDFGSQNPSQVAILWEEMMLGAISHDSYSADVERSEQSCVDDTSVSRSAERSTSAATTVDKVADCIIVGLPTVVPDMLSAYRESMSRMDGTKESTAPPRPKRRKVVHP